MIISKKIVAKKFFLIYNPITFGRLDFYELKISSKNIYVNAFKKMCFFHIRCNSSFFTGICLPFKIQDFSLHNT